MIPNFTSHQTGRLATYIHTSIMHTPVDTTSYANAGLETLVTDIILGPTTRTYRIYNVYRDQQQHLISSSTTAMMQTLHHITTESTQSNRTTIFAGDTNLHCRSHGIQPTRPLKPLALAEQFDLFVEQTTHVTVLNDGSHTRQQGQDLPTAIDTTLLYNPPTTQGRVPTRATNWHTHHKSHANSDHNIITFNIHTNELDQQPRTHNPHRFPFRISQRRLTQLTQSHITNNTPSWAHHLESTVTQHQQDIQNALNNARYNTNPNDDSLATLLDNILTHAATTARIIDRRQPRDDRKHRPKYHWNAACKTAHEQVVHHTTSTNTTSHNLTLAKKQFLTNPTTLHQNAVHIATTQHTQAQTALTQAQAKLNSALCDTTFDKWQEDTTSPDTPNPNPNAMWNIKKHMQTSTHTPRNILPPFPACNSPAQVVEAFRNQYETISQTTPLDHSRLTPSQHTLNRKSRRYYTKLLHSIEHKTIFNKKLQSPLNAPITMLELTTALQSRSPKSSTGRDQIPYTLLKTAGPKFKQLLLDVYNICLNTATFPALWKLAMIIPIPKHHGPLKSPAQYRPISLLSTIGKIMDRILAVRLIAHLLQHNILKPYQFGFRPFLSSGLCVTQLIQNIHNAWSEGNEYLLTLLDVAKAFDQVHRPSLMHKLHQSGIHGKYLAWVHSFLSQRTAQVLYLQHLSTPCTLEQGLAQGSSMSSPLFLVFINDLFDDAPPTYNPLSANPHEAYLQADDSSVGTALPPPPTDPDPLHPLNTARTHIISAHENLVNVAIQWGTLWRLHFAPAKTQHILFTRAITTLDPTHDDPELRQQQLISPPPNTDQTTLNWSNKPTHHKHATTANANGVTTTSILPTYKTTPRKNGYKFTITVNNHPYPLQWDPAQSRLLGIYLDHHLHGYHHIHKLVTKATQRTKFLYALTQSTWNTTPAKLVFLLEHWIRPHLQSLY